MSIESMFDEPGVAERVLRELERRGYSAAPLAPGETRRLDLSPQDGSLTIYLVWRRESMSLVFGEPQKTSSPPPERRLLNLGLNLGRDAIENLIAARLWNSEESPSVSVRTRLQIDLTKSLTLMLADSLYRAASMMVDDEPLEGVEE